MPLIGFGGAPFTMASYAIEGGPSTSYARTKAFMYAAAGGVAHALRPVRHGDGRLSPRAGRGRRSGDPDLRLVGRPTVARRLSRVRAAAHATHLRGAGEHDVPTIHFGVGTLAILPEMKAAGGDVIGVDWRLPIDEAWKLIGHDRGIQGNLDPTRLLGPSRRAVRARPTTCCAAWTDAPATSSISVTASFRPRRSRTCRRSRSTCTRSRCKQSAVCFSLQSAVTRR